MLLYSSCCNSFFRSSWTLGLTGRRSTAVALRSLGDAKGRAGRRPLRRAGASWAAAGRTTSERRIHFTAPSPAPRTRRTAHTAPPCHADHSGQTAPAHFESHRPASIRASALDRTERSCDGHQITWPHTPVVHSHTTSSATNSRPAGCTGECCSCAPPLGCSEHCSVAALTSDHPKPRPACQRAISPQRPIATASRQQSTPHLCTVAHGRVAALFAASHCPHSSSLAAHRFAHRS